MNVCGEFAPASKRVTLCRVKTLIALIVGVIPLVTFAAPPEPKVHEDLTFHTVPKPLLPGTITHDWPSFLWPTHNAVSTETNLAAKFPADGPPLVWEIKRGLGYSAPAVSDGKVVILHRVDDKECVDCLEAETGKRFWRFDYPCTYRDRYGINDGPRCAPVIDASLVYVYGVEGQLHCLDLSTGEVKWKRDLG